jgi:hypothetical protein
LLHFSIHHSLAFKSAYGKLEGASPDASRFFGSAGALPSRKNHSPFATHHLLFTAHRPPPFYQSLIAAVSRLADLPISRFADKFGSAGASPSHFVHSQTF